MQEQTGLKVLFFIGAAFVAIGMGVVAYSFYIVIKALMTFTWPNTYGRVISSQIQRRKQVGSKVYAPIISYEYSVEGKNYSSETISIQRSYSAIGPRRARETINRYPQSKQIIVYYNPKKPDESVLEPGGTWNLYLGPVGTLIFPAIGVGIIILYFYLKG